MASGLGRVEIDANNWRRFLCDICAGQGGNLCIPFGRGFCVASGLGRVELNANNWGRFYLTSGFGRAEMDANNRDVSV